MGLRKKNENRFNNYNPLASATTPELVGIIPHEVDYDLGTASLSRKENISLLASNSSKEALRVSIKWRPLKEPQGYVHFSTKLVLELGGLTYESSNLPMIYKPSTSSVRPGRIMQYGGPQSNLKFIISSPYRRMRLTFKGTMRSSEGDKFVMCNFIITPTGAIYDFMDQLDTQDVHEELVIIQGEYTISGASKQTLYLWGFYMRQFLIDESVQTKRIRAYLTNGQSLHVCHASNQLLGYTSFDMLPGSKPLEDNLVLDWSNIKKQVEQFEFELQFEGKQIKCKATLRENGSDFYKFTIEDEREGWAHIWLDDAIETKDELDTIELQREELIKRLDQNLIIKNSSFSGQEKPSVVYIEDVNCTCANLVGAKAASLAQLHSFKGDYVVPKAIVLTRFAHDMILEQDVEIKKSIEKLTQLASEGKSLKEHCEQLRKQISDTPLPKVLLDELQENVTKRFAQEQEFAVRSSSWGEDEEDMSGAGQLTTLLNVKGVEEIAKAVMACFASKFSDTNIEYKRQHGLPLSMPMAVVIQEMIDCDKSGVMFTCDPRTGDQSEYTITANYGLGESVVSAQAEPDSIRMNPETKEKSIEIGAKNIIHGSMGNNPDIDKSKCCMDDNELSTLAKCGQNLTLFYQSPRDIEWGFKQNQLYLFQSRPVTGLDTLTKFEVIHECDSTSAAENEFSTRANVGEVMPYAITPLSLTFANGHWNVMGFKMAHKFSSKIKLDDWKPFVPAEVFYNSYHAFFRLRGGMILTVREGEKSLMSRAMEIGLFGHELDEKPEIYKACRGIGQKPNYFQGAKFNWFTLKHKFAPFKTIEKEKVVMQRLRCQVRELKLASGYSKLEGSDNMRCLYEQMKAVQDYCFNSWINHIIILLLGNNTNIGAMMVLSKYIKDPKRIFSALNRILGAAENVLSAEIPHRISKMSQLINELGQDEVDKFLSCSSDDALAYLESKGNAQLVAEFQTFLQRFGHRCYNEFELSTKSWAQDKEKLVEAIKNNCKAPKGSGSNERRPVKEIIDSLELKGLGKIDELLLKYLIGPQCQTMLSAREKTKDILIEYTDILREATRALAKEMHRQLRIPDENLLYYFFYDELEPLIREPQPSLVVQAIRRRTIHKDVFTKTWLFDEIIEGHKFIPNHEKPDPKLEEATLKAPELYGTPASSGKVRGKVCLVMGFQQIDKVRHGDILVTHSTDIAFSTIFPMIAGIVTEVGGLISHGAVVAREYGLPSLLGIPNVTKILEDGEEIILDADTGTIKRLDMSTHQ